MRRLPDTEPRMSRNRSRSSCWHRAQPSPARLQTHGLLSALDYWPPPTAPTRKNCCRKRAETGDAGAI